MAFRSCIKVSDIDSRSENASFVSNIKTEGASNTKLRLRKVAGGHLLSDECVAKSLAKAAMEKAGSR